MTTHNKCYAEFMRITIIILFLFIIGQSYGQVQVKIDYPLKDTKLTWYSHKNLTYIEKDTINQIGIEVSSCRSRNIIVSADSLTKIEEYWAPIKAGKKPTDALAEYTLTTARNLGGIKEDKISHKVEYIDNTELYWLKEFIIQTTQTKTVQLTIYCNNNDTLRLVNNLVLEIK